MSPGRDSRDRAEWQSGFIMGLGVGVLVSIIVIPLVMGLLGRLT